MEKAAEILAKFDRSDTLFKQGMPFFIFTVVTAQCSFALCAYSILTGPPLYEAVNFTAWNLPDDWEERTRSGLCILLFISAMVTLSTGCMWGMWVKRQNLERRKTEAVAALNVPLIPAGPVKCSCAKETECKTNKKHKCPCREGCTEECGCKATCANIY